MNMANVERFAMTVIRWKTLIELTSLSRSMLSELQNPKSQRYDPRFPKKIQLGPRAVGWMLSDIERWLRERTIQSAHGGSTV
jgi:prophage regulatory protein